MCDALVPGQMLSDVEATRDYNLRHPENPANPYNVFGLHHAMHGIPNAHPEWACWGLRAPATPFSFRFLCQVVQCPKLLCLSTYWR
jgi:hypothetical protein